MAVAEGKKRVYLTLDVETIKKLEELEKHEKDQYRGGGHFTQSNVVQQLVDARHEILKKFGE